MNLSLYFQGKDFLLEKVLRISLWLFLCTCSILLVSCDKDDPVPKEPEAIPEEPVLEEEEEEEEEEEQGGGETPDSHVTFFYPDLVMDN